MRTVFTKSVAAGTNTKISTLTSGTVSGGVSLTFNGTTVSTATTNASSAIGTNTLSFASLPTGMAVGAQITDTSAAAIPVGTTIAGIIGTTVLLSAAIATNNVGNGDTIAYGPATIDTASANNSAAGRRVYVHSTGADTGINWTVVGTNATGAVISDTFAGASAGDAISNLDFVTVSSITPSGASASTVSAGSGPIASSPWVLLNWRGFSPLNVGVAVELVSGSATYQVEYTYDSPNDLQGGAAFPLAFTNLTPSALKGPASSTGDGVFTGPMVALRLTTETGTGVLRCRIVEAGTG